MGTLPQAFFFFSEKLPHIFTGPELVGMSPQALFFEKNGPHIFTSPELVGTLPPALFFFQKNGPHILGGFLLELFAIAESETLLVA